MTTVFIGKFFGMLFTFIALGVLFNREHASKVAADMIDHAASQMMAGMVPLILGSWLVLQHNVWAWNWDLLITLVGWLLLLTGLFRLWCVEAWVDLVKKHQDSAPLWGGIFMLVIGILLLYIGFFS